mgnify:CR=1 FL=1
MLADTVSIAATSAGVTGTIVVGKGARLKRLTCAYVDADGQPQIIELTWAGCPTPLRFVPPIAAYPIATSGAAIAVAASIPLDVTVEKADTVTVKVTSNADVTTQVGLVWD